MSGYLSDGAAQLSSRRLCRRTPADCHTSRCIDGCCDRRGSRLPNRAKAADAGSGDGAVDAVRRRDSFWRSALASEAPVRRR